MIFDDPTRLKTLVKEYDFHGQKLYLRKLSVAEWRRLIALRAELVKADSDQKGGFAWGSHALSKQLCDEAGKLLCDSDEWRQKLESNLSADEMEDLLLAAHEWSGVWSRADEQKKS